MAILVIAEQFPTGGLRPSTRQVLAAAQKIGGPIDLLVWGGDTREAVVQALALPGLARVLDAQDASLGDGLAETLTAWVRPIARRYSHILTAASAAGKNWMPRLAALEDVALVTDIVGVDSPDTFVRPIYAGSLWATVHSSDALKLITVRTTAFTAVVGEGAPGVPVEALVAPTVKALSRRVAVHHHSGDGRPTLENARVVVSGGRGLASAEHFEALLAPLAEKLNAALGASRAAVDLGFVPNDYQVGQTGKVVAPELYIAVGISGAIQHLAGMQASRVIVAINKDPDAPIFGVADYGLVGDLNQLVPELTAAL